MKRIIMASWLCGCVAVMGVESSGTKVDTVKLLTLDPGHFHAALVQKVMVPGVDPLVHVYAPAGADLDLHMQKIQGYNTRPDSPTRWESKIYTGSNYLARLVSERAGNVVVLAGNNAKKTRYIAECVKAGFNVLSDKPMAITPQDFELLKQAFKDAREKGVLLYDIMTERNEITTILQKELAHSPALFGELEPGTLKDPSVTKESVHHFFKYVSGKPLQRPPWFFDSTQQGDAIVDVTTHLVDLVQWECFPEQVLSTEDVKVLSARRWTTPVTQAQFKKATSLDTYPDYLKKYADARSVLNVDGNGEFTYTLKGIHAKVSVRWNFEAPEGAGDTHYSLMRGTKAALIIRQGAEQAYKPTLYVEPRGGQSLEAVKPALDAALASVGKVWPGVTAKKTETAWEIVIPAGFRVGHEPHFGQVMEKYLKYLSQHALPTWEEPNMIVKYYTIMQAYQMAK